MRSIVITRLLAVLSSLSLPKGATRTPVPFSATCYLPKVEEFTSMTGKEGEKTVIEPAVRKNFEGMMFEHPWSHARVVVESQSSRRVYFRHAGTKRKPIPAHLALRDDMDYQIFSKVYKPVTPTNGQKATSRA